MGTRQIRRSFLDENIRPKNGKTCNSGVPPKEGLRYELNMFGGTGPLMSFKKELKSMYTSISKSGNPKTSIQCLTNLHPPRKVLYNSAQKKLATIPPQKKTHNFSRRCFFSVSGFSPTKTSPSPPEKNIATGRPSNNHQVGHLVVHHQVDHQAVVDIMELLHLMEDGK